jgi:hypothetical protein
MGRDIPDGNFTPDDFKEFHHRLREESRLLMRLFKEGSFESTEGVCGLELEGWLVDKNYDPSASNEEFLKRVTSPLVFHELSKFNFEINSDPHKIGGHLLNNMESELSQLWQHCHFHAAEMDKNILAIGILPTIKSEMLTLKNISSCPRYSALNQQIQKLRGDEPVNICIEGNESLFLKRHDIMMEAAATSLQIHFQINHEEAGRLYNTAQVLAAPMTAAAANSPYLLGKDLWEESRIPTFEQAVQVASFRDSHGENIGRVTFGTGYVRNSIMELFLENLDGYPVLLPQLFDEEEKLLSHLRFHNGTIWRWNRPLIGINSVGQPHIRIEHRVAAAGPSVTDTIANIGLFLGLIRYYVNRDVPIESQISFEASKDNFYQASQFGLRSKLKWIDGAESPIRTLFQESLLPNAREGLLQAGFDEKEVSYYIDEIMGNRIRSGQNGAVWQKSFMNKHRGSFAEMTHAYHENQKQNIPVYKWKI